MEVWKKKIFFFFSKARKYGEEIKIKKKNVFLFFRPDNRLFWSEVKKHNDEERSVFWRNRRSKQTSHRKIIVQWMAEVNRRE